MGALKIYRDNSCKRTKNVPVYDNIDLTFELYTNGDTYEEDSATPKNDYSIE